MGTQRVQMKGVLPWLVRLARGTITRDFCPALASLVSSVQNIFLLTVHHFNLCVPIGPHRPATWAGSRAGPPVSEYVSAVETDMVGFFTTKTVPTPYIQ
jgi:hypothetical protein